MTAIEIWGYLSMAVVLLSMTMQNIRTLRWVNSIACAMFVVYGIFINAVPIIVMNSLVICINVWNNLKKKV